MKRWVVQAVLTLLLIQIVLQPALAELSVKEVFGDNKIIPGGRLGTLALGISKQEVITRIGHPIASVSNPGGSWLLVRWDWPTANLGRFERWNNLGLSMAFCNSNQRLFVVIGSHVSPGREYAGVVNLHVNRLTFPEGLSPEKHRLNMFLQTFGNAASVIPRIGSDPANIHIFANGAVAARAADSDFIFGIGTHATEVCEGGNPPRQPYIAHLGRLGRDFRASRVALSRSGDARAGTIGEDVVGVEGTLPRFKLQEPVYMLVELSFPATLGRRTIPFVRKFYSPDGLSRAIEIPRLIEPGATKRGIVFWLGLDHKRVPGRWRGELTVGDVVIATAEFELE